MLLNVISFYSLTIRRESYTRLMGLCWYCFLKILLCVCVLPPSHFVCLVFFFGCSKYLSSFKSMVFNLLTSQLSIYPYPSIYSCLNSWKFIREFETKYFSLGDKALRDAPLKIRFSNLNKQNGMEGMYYRWTGFFIFAKWSMYELLIPYSRLNRSLYPPFPSQPLLFV